MWSVPDGTPVGAPVWLDSGWTTLVPLGNGDAAPLALVSNDDVVGLVPAGQGPTPIRRLADRSLAPYDLGPPRAAGRWYREMCDMLVSDVEPRSVMDHLPPGAHTGPLCS
jgi:hypothetical protein